MSARQNPYVGLVPYTEADAEWFFGRDQEVRLITANLRAARLTLLYGASGVGKSSVLLAGVLPRLQHLVVEHRPVAAGNGRGTLLADRPPIAVTVFREWRDPPLAQLAAGMRSAVADACDDDVPPWDGAEPFTDWLRTLTARARTLLVVLDQFEEYFQYHSDETGPDTFGTQFPAIVNDPDLRVHFLMSLREDAWSRLDRFKGEIPELFGNYLRIDYLDRAAAHDAIVKPLEHYNETAAEPVGIEPALLDAILRDVRTGRLALAEGNAAGQTPEALAGGDERVETPYLQLVMQRLWAAATANGGRTLTVAALGELGGAAAIVSGHLTDAMNELPPEDQATAADIFGYLVTPSKTKVAHRASDLAYWAQRPEADVRRVLDDLASGDRRILRRVPPPGDEDVERYEIFHDVLADAILEWSSENRNRRQRAAARRERARARRRKLLQILSVLAIVAAVVTVVLVVRHQQAKGAATEAESRETGLQRLSRELAQSAETELATDAERGLLYSVAAYQSWETPQAKAVLAKAYAAARARAAYTDHSSPKCPQCAPQGSPDVAPRPVSLTRPFLFFGYDDTTAQSRSPASLSHDGHTLAIIRHGHVDLWRPVDGTVATLPDVRGALRVAFIGKGDRLVVTTGRRRLILGSAEAGGSPRELADRAGLSAVSADGRYVATSSGRTLRVGPIDDLRSGKKIELAFSPGLLAFSPTDSGLLVIAPGYRRKPALWHWRQDRVPSAPSPGRVYVGCPASAMFSDDGRTLVTTAPGGHVLGWTMPALKPRFDVRPTGFCPSLVLLDRAGQQLLVASGNVATLVSARSGQQLLALGGHTGAITGAAFSPSGRLVATASEDGTARVWDSAGGSQLLDLRARGMEDRVAPLATVTFTPDERFVVTTDEDGVARMWEVTSRSRLGAWRARVRSATMTDAGHVRAAFPDGRIVDIAADGHRQVIERLGGQGLFSVDFAPSAPRGVASIFGRRGHGGDGLYALNLADHTRKKLTRRDVSNAGISADGRDILVWGRRPRIWHDGRPGKVIALTRFERPAYAYGVLSDDARRALVLRYLRGARVVDVAAGKSVPLRGNVAGITNGQFSPDGRRVVTAGDRGARVWDTATGRVVAPPLGESASPVRSAAYSRPDGRDIVVLDRNGTIRIFNAATYTERSVLAPRPGDVYGVAFNSDTQTVMTVGPEGLDLRQCDVCAPPDWLEQHAQSRLTRTPQEAREFIRKVKEG